MNALKYYVYLSEPKVEMLYSQMPFLIREKLETEIKLNLKIVEVSFSKKQFSDNIYTKLGVVLAYLHECNIVGSISAPQQYFAGTMNMGWAQIYPGVLFFGGVFNNVTIELGGSMNNLLGYKWSSDDIPTGISHTPWLISLLSKELEMLFPFDSTNTRYGQVQGGSVEGVPPKEYEKRVLSATSHWVYDITQSPLKYQIGKFEFVAKVLRNTNYDPRMPGSDKKIILGTTNYVARAN